MNQTSKICSADSTDFSEIWNLVPPERESLTKLRRIAVRNNSWFSALNWKQRRFLDAVISTVNKIRSHFMLRVLAPLIQRLLKTVGNSIRNNVFMINKSLAKRMMGDVAQNIVHIAQNWGNQTAIRWFSEAFIKYLTIMHMPENKNLLSFSVSEHQPLATQTSI